MSTEFNAGERYKYVKFDWYGTKRYKNGQIYDIRLLINADDKEAYSKMEILKLLDTVAREKDNYQLEE